MHFTVRACAMQAYECHAWSDDWTVQHVSSKALHQWCEGLRFFGCLICGVAAINAVCMTIGSLLLQARADFSASAAATAAADLQAVMVVLRQLTKRCC
jgi:hypothetical protein